MRGKGSVLILFLWVLILIGVLATSVAFRARLATKISGYETRHFERTYDYLAAMNLARYFIGSDDASDVDHLEDSWYGVPQGFDGMDFSRRLRLEISDEESKINLNKASPVFLRRFFEILNQKGIKLKTDPQDLASSIAAWRGSAAAFGKPTLGHEHKRAPFESLQELYLVQYITPGDVELLRPFVTVFGAPRNVPLRLNLNTAHSYIIEALIFSLAGGEFPKRELWKKIEGFREGSFSSGGERQIFQGGDLVPAVFMERLGLTPSPTMTVLVKQFLNYMTVDSKTFCVHAGLRDADKKPVSVEAVLGPADYRPTGERRVYRKGMAGAGELEILSWREGVVFQWSG